MAVHEEPSMQVFVVSDGTGDTGTATVRAAMLQFQSPWRLRVFGEIRRPPEAKRVVARAAEENALVVFSLVERIMVEVMQREAQQQGDLCQRQGRILQIQLRQTLTQAIKNSRKSQ